MNKKFILTLLSSPVLFTSILSMVMFAKPAHANQVVNPANTRLSCVRSPHSTGKVCIQVALAQTQPKTQTNVIEFSAPPQQQVQIAQAQPDDFPELEFTDEESNEAIQRFGCDCPACLNAVRALHGLAPLPM